jgi:hypothetical protein
VQADSELPERSSGVHEGSTQGSMERGPRESACAFRRWGESPAGGSTGVHGGPPGATTTGTVGGPLGRPDLRGARRPQGRGKRVPSSARKLPRHAPGHGRTWSRGPPTNRGTLALPGVRRRKRRWLWDFRRRGSVPRVRHLAQSVSLPPCRVAGAGSGSICGYPQMRPRIWYLFAVLSTGRGHTVVPDRTPAGPLTQRQRPRAALDLGLSKEMAGPVMGPAAPGATGAAGRGSHDRTMPWLAASRNGAARRASFPEGATRVPHGAIWVPQGATPVAPIMRKRVAPWRFWRRLALGKLVVVKCHSGCQKVPLGPDHSPPPWHLGGHYLAQVRI